MNELCQIIKNMVIPNFINMETSIKTYDRNADCCGAPAWRFVHPGMLNGQTAERVGKFPIYVSEDSIFPEDGSLFGRYVTKKKSRILSKGAGKRFLFPLVIMSFYIVHNLQVT